MRKRLCCAALAAIALAACQKPAPPTTPEVLVGSAAKIPSTPGDDAWDRAPEHLARLVLQDLVEPRLLQPSTPEVRVRALTDGNLVAFRLQWADPTKDDLPLPSLFSDACAVQLPSRIEADAPAPQMGEANRPVQITYWRASWQAVVDGRGDGIRDLYPNAAIDHYPFEAAALEKGSAEQLAMEARYAPARALGNPMAGPRQSPVESLLAEGPGTLSPAPRDDASGWGVRTASGWSVVLARRLPEGLAAHTRSQVAFAVWQGAQHEAGARKMRTGWIPLALQETP